MKSLSITSRGTPAFIGHYWRKAEASSRLAHNVACVDYSVAKGGSLVAYQWDGEREIDDGKFETVAARGGD